MVRKEVGFADLFNGIQRLSVGIFLLIVEFISIREKADKKTKGDMEKVETAIGKLMTKEDLLSILEELKKKGGENVQVD